MTIQALFDKQAISMFPIINKMITDLPSFERNQLINITLNEICNCKPPINKMTLEQIKETQERIINKYNYNRENEGIS